MEQIGAGLGEVEIMMGFHDNSKMMDIAIQLSSSHNFRFDNHKSLSKQLRVGKHNILNIKYTMVVFKMCDSGPSARYSPVCNVLCLWRIWLIPTYRVYRLYRMIIFTSSCASILLIVINPRRMRSEGYCSCRVCVSVCLSVCLSVCYSITHFTSGYSRPKRTHIFSGGWRSKNM